MGIIKYNSIIKLLFSCFLIGEAYAYEQTCIIGFSEIDIDQYSKENNLISPIKFIFHPILDQNTKNLDIHANINNFIYTSTLNNPNIKICSKGASYPAH